MKPLVSFFFRGLRIDAFPDHVEMEGSALDLERRHVEKVVTLLRRASVHVCEAHSDAPSRRGGPSWRGRTIPVRRMMFPLIVVAAVGTLGTSSVEAQTTSTTIAPTTTIAQPTTTTTSSTSTTSTSLPAFLRCEEDIARGFASLATGMVQCHDLAARRSVKLRRLEARCDKKKHARRLSACLAKVTERACRNFNLNVACERHAMQASQPFPAQDCPPHVKEAQPVLLDLRAQLATSLHDRDRDAYCGIAKPVEGLEPPSPSCSVTSGFRGGRRPRLNRADTVIVRCGTNVALGLSGYVAAVTDCRVRAAVASFNGTAFSELDCLAGLTCGQEPGCQPCADTIDRSSMCQDVRDLTDRFLREVFRPCLNADGTTLSCDDGNACTMDRCDGGTCLHVAKGDGEACAEDNPIADPCTNDVCSGGICLHKKRNAGDYCGAPGDLCQVCAFRLVDDTTVTFGCGAVDCDDRDGCTVDACDSEKGCVHVRRPGCS